MIRILVLIAIAALSLQAQVQSVKHHFGDDPRWADPGFDDSTWKDSSAALEFGAYPLETRMWLRYKIRVPDRYMDPVLGIRAAVAEVFIEGASAYQHGKLPPQFEDTADTYFAVPIPRDLAVPGRILTVAIRAWNPPGRGLRGIPVLPVLQVHRIGEERFYAREMARSERSIYWSIAAFSLVLLILLAAISGQWQQRDHLLLVIFLGIMIAFYASWVPGYLLPWIRYSNLTSSFLNIFVYCLKLELLAAVLGLRSPWWLRSTQAIVVVIQLAFTFGASYYEAPSWFPLAVQSVTFSYILIAIAALSFVAKQRVDRFQDRLVPLGIALIVSASMLQRTVVFLGVTPAISVGDARFSWVSMANLLFAISLVLVLIFRMRKSSISAFKLEAQLSAARSVQEMLLGGEAQPASPGFSIEKIYTPADEVGGDFFRILAAPNDSTLVIVGDVSGKGLRAAMLVSMIVGVLLDRRSNDPGLVLAELNDAITGHLEGGFVTCSATLIAPDGSVTLANGGHPSAYCRGEEVPVSPGLPLGMVRGVIYETSENKLAVGDQLTVVSDGVVEAENAKRELFGFDRTRDISRKSAQEIAEAAKAWGQNDDITVVTVRKLKC